MKKESTPPIMAYTTAFGSFTAKRPVRADPTSAEIKAGAKQAIVSAGPMRLSLTMAVHPRSLKSRMTSFPELKNVSPVIAMTQIAHDWKYSMISWMQPMIQVQMAAVMIMATCALSFFAASVAALETRLDASMIATISAAREREPNEEVKARLIPFLTALDVSLSNHHAATVAAITNWTMYVKSCAPQTKDNVLTNRTASWPVWVELDVGGTMVDASATRRPLPSWTLFELDEEDDEGPATREETPREARHQTSDQRS